MTITYKGASVFYEDQGKGHTVVLVHGFLENSKMWDPFMDILLEKYRIIRLDLFGHGLTDSLGYIHTMEEMAEAINHILEENKISEVAIVGHSMGGYVGCAFAKAYPEKIKGLCLLNSTPLADTKERKLLRKRANKMAKTQFKSLVRMSYSNLFDATSKIKCKKEISEGLVQALSTSVQGYMACNTGMSMRDDFSDIIFEGNFYKSMILGKEDWIISADKHARLFESFTQYFKVLDNGHMSHISQRSQTLEHLTNLLGEIYIQ